MTRRGLVLVTIALALAAAAAVFVVAQPSVRQLEATTSSLVVGLIGPRRVFRSGPSVLVVPYHHAAFRAVVTPSCSSLASVLSLLMLGALARVGGLLRRVVAVGLAVCVVAAGNLMRIAASLTVGLYAGRVSLVLFHDWVGNIFAFLYTVGGFILMLYVVLPADNTAMVSGAPSTTRARADRSIR